MKNKLTNTKLVIAYGTLSSIIFLMGSINGAYTYYTKGSIFPLTKATIWMGLIGLFSAVAASIEICSNIEEPITPTHSKTNNSVSMPSSDYVQSKIRCSPTQATKRNLNNQTPAPCYPTKKSKKT